MEVSVSFLKEGNYKDHISKINKSNADYIHYDVMDGKFVDNKNLSIKELTTYLDLSHKKNDIHLMVKDPEKYIDSIAFYNIDYVTIHSEIKNVDKYIEKIKGYGFKVGLAINPETDIEKVLPFLNDINLILVMSVHPGKSGQTFIEKSKEKLDKLKEIIKEKSLNIKLEVDGGVCDDVLDKITSADIAVSASYALDNLDNINKIKEIGSLE